MKRALVILSSSFLWAGCGLLNSPDAVPARSGAGAPARGAAQSRTLTPVIEPIGHVVVVRSDLRFVVIDFFLSQTPKVDQHLGIYRDGRKVGDVKVSEQNNVSFVAADIVAGEAKVGDEVRPDN